MLGHVFFSEGINEPLFELLKINTDKNLIKKYISFIEEMYSDGDDDVKNIVIVTILERLGDDGKVLSNAYSYFSKELICMSKEVESFWGRR
ncbi:hypothetical protein OW730_06325 [Oceanirhabdus sp. W0125-5]|nr:hypothetical protein [Oceanirhabdus sp. W0125-5]WBW98381.1 hypothetical protein OW730_06325 [Oceanirhabdus sp. W0125-5]